MVRELDSFLRDFDNSYELSIVVKWLGAGSLLLHEEEVFACGWLWRCCGRGRMRRNEMGG